MAKQFKITNAEIFGKKNDLQRNRMDLLIEGPEWMQVSDGYHSMDELYEHRHELFIALCYLASIDPENGLAYYVWRSKKHHDDTMYEGHFILGFLLKTPTEEQITYHLPLRFWDQTEFAETLEKSLEWDKHTSHDVLRRLRLLQKKKY